MVGKNVLTFLMKPKITDLPSVGIFRLLL